MKVTKKTGFLKPKYGTCEEWTEWHANAKKNHPFRYWFSEILTPAIHNFMFNNYIHSLRNYIVNRVHDTHVLASKQFKPGKWIDLCDRILPCLFDELSDFVEIELAALHSDYKYSFFTVRLARDKKLGLAYLDEYIKDDRNIIIKELYLWWTETVPNRKDIWSCESPAERQLLEKKYDVEDTKMLIKLIRIRGYLWT